MLLLLSLGRLFLLALPFLLETCLPSLSSPLSPHHALALIRLFLAKVGLSLILMLFSFRIWCSGLTALFLFLLAKTALAYLPTALCGTEATLCFLAGSVCSSFSAEACTILNALCWSRQHQQICHFYSFPFSFYLTLTLLSPPYPLLYLPFYLKLWQVWQELFSFSSCAIRLQWVPKHSFLPENHAADELSRWEALRAPFAIPCSLSPLISRIHSFFLGLDAYCFI